MPNAPFKLHENYWDTYTINPKDLDFLYNHLLETETPFSSKELTEVLVLECIKREKQALQNKQLLDGKIYSPKEHYNKDDTLLFPALDWTKGKVTGVRQGYNPDVTSFEVISVEMEQDGERQFAAGLETHKLNQPIELSLEDPYLDPKFVLEKYGAKIVAKLNQALQENPDLVCIANRWFPRALLVDINIGHLNLAEAVLDMSSGGPLPAKSLLEQIDLPTDVNSRLTEFSLNNALYHDSRFDEVGSVGEVTWFLRRLEPDFVREIPPYLKASTTNYDSSKFTEEMISLENELDDELDDNPVSANDAVDEADICLIYPHWRAGTLPLTNRIRKLFPTAMESPRVQFTLIDKDSGEKYPGWVVRPDHFVYGLREWYTSQGIIPGSLIKLSRSERPGEVFLKAEKRRSNREWIRTVLIGADGGIVFATLKQVVTAAFDERMAIAIPDMNALDALWKTNSQQNIPLLKSVIFMMRELAKLNPQGHVHAEELYAGLNVIRRCPPGPILQLLSTQPIFIHVGDLYYRLDEPQEEI